MSEYDKQRDIAAEGQRAAAFYARREEEGPVTNILRALQNGDDKWGANHLHNMAGTLWAIANPAGIQTKEDLSEMARECLARTVLKGGRK